METKGSDLPVLCMTRALLHLIDGLYGTMREAKNDERSMLEVQILDMEEIPFP